jgi:hypothetical protein
VAGNKQLFLILFTPFQPQNSFEADYFEEFNDGILAFLRVCRKLFHPEAGYKSLAL